jgi:hypothetical protein
MLRKLLALRYHEKIDDQQKRQGGEGGFQVAQEELPRGKGDDGEKKK